MSADGHRRTGEPQIDLDTIRETLAYMHGDLAQAPRLHKLRDMLGDVIREIETLEAAAKTASGGAPAPKRVVAFPTIRPIFKPWRAGA